jgi:hypothetical protein
MAGNESDGDKEQKKSSSHSYKDYWLTAGLLGVIGAVIGGIALIIATGSAGSTGHPNSPSSPGLSSPANSPNFSPSVVSSPRLSSPSRVIYTVNSRKWAPKSVPGLELAKGDVVMIKVISGQWKCADVTGPAGVQGNHYKAFYHHWAVPSAPFCSLIDRVGNGPWRELGLRLKLVAGNAGGLRLATNELMPRYCSQPPTDTSCYTDDKGSIKVQISVSRAS